MRMQSLVGRGLVSNDVAEKLGALSDAGNIRPDRQFNRYVASTSGDGKQLREDGGGRRDKGAIGRNAIDGVNRRGSVPGGGRTKDFGPNNFGAGHLDGGTNKRTFPSESRVKRDKDWRDFSRRIPTVAQARKSSAVEYLGSGEDQWYGAFEGRQE